MAQIHSLNRLDEMFIDFIMQRQTRIQERLQKLIDENQIGIDLNAIDWKKTDSAKNALQEMGVELIKEIHNFTFPHTEVWKIKRNGEVVGSFKVDQYGIVTDL